MKKPVSFFVAVIYSYVQLSAAQDGQVKGMDLPSFRQPMYLIPDTLEFWPHNAAGYLVFKHQESIDLFCADGFTNPNNAQTILTATYSSLTNRFKIGTENHKLEEITCKRNPTFLAREQGNCGNQYKLVSIGYDVIGRGFKTIYDICFDYKEMVAKYVKHTLRPGVLQKSKVSERQANFNDILSFSEYRFGPFYTQATELTLNGIFITRGHLAAQADFFYGVEQISTYVFPNAAPQWSKFNNGNWEEIERLIRSNLHQRTLECYTGVLGVMPYYNKKTNVQKDALYLDDAHKKIPTPIHYFRVVYEPQTQKGVVFIGVNNVFQKPLPQEYIICNPITEKIKGIILNPARMNQLNRGYLYACDFHEFQRKYPYLPSLTVTSLLFEDVSTV